MKDVKDMKDAPRFNFPGKKVKVKSAVGAFLQH
jgi:hypothetical protein